MRTRSQRRVRRVLAASLGLLALAPMPTVRASDGAGCSRTWTSRASGSELCTFHANGTPIQISGTASAATASAATSIRVWVSPAGNPEIVLVACTGSGAGSASCGAELAPIVADARTPQLPGQLGVSFQCNATWTGNRAGSARCFNPEPCPTVADPSCISVLGEPLAVPM